MQELLGLDENHFQGLYLLGHIFQQKGWNDEAIEKYEAAHAIVPTELEPVLQLGILYKEKNDYDQASAYFQKVLNIDAANATATDFFANLTASKRSQEIQEALNNAKQAEESDDIDTAIMHYDSIIDIDNHNLEARYKLGTLYESKNMFDEATFEYEQALELDKTGIYKDLPRKMGELYTRKGKMVEAVDALALAKQYYPNDVDIRIKLITQLKFKALNNFCSNEELAELNQSIRAAVQNNQNPCDMLELGLFLSKGLDLSIDEDTAINQSIESFKQVVALDPSNTFAMTELAKVYHRKNMMQEVEATYKQILEKDPETTYIHQKLSEMYFEQGRFEESLSEMRQLLS